MKFHHFGIAAILALPLDAIFLTSGLKGSQSIPLACLVAVAIVWWFRKPLDGLMHPPQLPKDRYKDLAHGNRRTRRAKERRSR